MLEWIGLYGGEGFLKFNNDLWYIKHYTDGDDMFAFAKNLIGLETYIDVRERDGFYLNKNGIQIENFYTFIGDIYYDFGLIGTIFFALLLNFICVYLIKIRKKYPLEIIFILAIMSHIYLIGFTAYIHRAYSAQFALLIPLFTIIILTINRKFK